MKKKNVVVLTGAGVSAESGLKTFRDSDGLWEGYNIEDVATPRAWKRNPQLVLDFYNERRRNVAAAQPNAAHYGLADLEKDFDVNIITQNIDDLHERAGSTNVLHLHGEIFKMCSDIDRSCVTDIRGDIGIGHVTEKGHQFRPDIVWFEEAVPMIEEAVLITMKADIFVVVGSSLQVYPAAGLVQYVPDSAEKYIIDKKIPYVSQLSSIKVIEQPATEGVKILKQLLRILRP
ncbi:MAG TPA: Sir2 family NAD-dependent protein deacetylase [Flavitalea sp.]|nr:Sir2 family NAD-dependent protein deacetylase [Flavitalea sp.]